MPTRVALSLLLYVVTAGTVMAQTTYYVRTDGGSNLQCTGRTDAAYPGSGTSQPCAWDHPFRALPPGGTPAIAGGDTLMIRAGSYRMGYGAPATETCDAGGSYECHMPPIPSGPSPSQRTRILGVGWASGCATPPELWGAERPWYVINLDGSSNVEVACLEITDHSSCIEFYPSPSCPTCPLPCQRDTPPYGDWAPMGIHAQDSANVRLADLNIHGMADRGILAGRLTDWTVERVRIAANGSAGWDGDLWDAGGDDCSGDLIFRNVEVAYNGCGETWPAGTVNLDSCWAQQRGGYGDGFAPGASGGRWVLEDLNVHHNTSDGIDLLYLRGNSTIEVRRLKAEGSAGNQLKVAGPAWIENALLVGNCAYFDGRPMMEGGDQCRAGGSALSADLHRGNQITVMNSTVTGQGDCLMDVGCDDSRPGDPDPDCNGAEVFQVRNGLFDGNVDWRQPWENTCLVWWDNDNLPANPTSLDYNIVWEAKDNPCPGAHDICGQNPQIVSPALAAYDGHLLTNSPAINSGTTVGAPGHDLDGRPRDSFPDRGAYEGSDVIFANGFDPGLVLWSLSLP